MILPKLVSAANLNPPDWELALFHRPPAWLHGPLTLAGSAAGGWQLGDTLTCDMPYMNHGSTGTVSNEKDWQKKSENTGNQSRQTETSIRKRFRNQSWLIWPLFDQYYTYYYKWMCAVLFVDRLTSKNSGLYTGRGSSTCPRCPGQLLKSWQQVEHTWRK